MTCPNCSHVTVPVLYGYPGPGTMERVDAGEVVLGGCVIGGDDAPRGCPSCGAAVWSHGVFRRGDDLKAALGRRGAGLIAALTQEGDLWLSDDRGTVAVVPAAEAELIVMVTIIQLFADGDRLGRWLRRRSFASAGGFAGPLTRVEVGGAAPSSSVTVGSGEDTIRVSDGFQRLVLCLLHEVARRAGLATVDDLLAYFTETALPLEATVSR